MSSCSACRTSGRRWRSSEGSPAGTSGGSGCVAIDSPRGIGAGIPPEQQVELVLGGLDPPLDLGDLRRDLAERRRGVGGLEGGGRALVELALEEVVGLLEGVHGLLRDHELRVELAEREVRAWRRPRPARAGRRAARPRVARYWAFAASFSRRIRPQMSSSQPKLTLASSRFAGRRAVGAELDRVAAARPAAAGSRSAGRTPSGRCPRAPGPPRRAQAAIRTS